MLAAAAANCLNPSSQPAHSRLNTRLHSCFCRAAPRCPGRLLPKTAVTAASTASMGRVCGAGARQGRGGSVM